MIRVTKTLKVCNNFRLEIIKNSKSRIVPHQNTDELICLPVKWVGWTGACAGTVGCITCVGLGEANVTQVQL